MNQELFDYIKNSCYEYREEGFTLSSGKTSKHYFDLRNATLHPYYLKLIIEEFEKKFRSTEFGWGNVSFAIAGLTMGADPINYLLAMRLEHEYDFSVRSLIVRKEPKNHGTGKRVEGLINDVAGGAIVVDDVITTGKSSLIAIDAIREVGIPVEEVYCILDREEGGKEAIEASGVKVFSLFKKSDFIETV